MRGYFGIGIEGVSKPLNVGTLFRSAHAFGASFVFTVAADYSRRRLDKADTSGTGGSLPFYAFPDLDRMMLPEGCKLVGVELTDEAVELPSFHHPQSCAYVLGPERSSLSPAMQARCDYLVQIPTKFCINVAIAGTVILYDRLVSLGKFAPRPLMPGGPVQDLPAHQHGAPKFRTAERMELYRDQPPPDGFVEES